MDNSYTQERRHPVVGAFLGTLQLALVIGVLVAALAVNRILVLTGGSEAPEPAPVRAALVEVVRPSSERAPLVITETGTVEPRTELSISPQVGGRVVSVARNFASGGVFEADDVLFTIDQEDYRLRLRQAEADLRSAESNVALEEAEAESAIREWKLINPDTDVPPLVARAPQLAQAKASVDIAKAAVADAKLALRRTEFSLPFSGRVLTTSIEPGLTVAANQSYGTVYSEDGVEVVLALSADDVEALEPVVGRQVVVTGRVGARGAKASASVTRVEGALDPRSRLIGVVVGFEDGSPFLPGSFVSAAIEGPELEDIFVLPAAAVNAAGQVWVVEDGLLVRRSTTILVRSDESAITESFAFAEGIVTTPPPGAREGQEVRIQVAGSGQLETAQVTR